MQSLLGSVTCTHDNLVKAKNISLQMRKGEKYLHTITCIWTNMQSLLGSVTCTHDNLVKAKNISLQMRKGTVASFCK